jgi:hypothetical protein
MYVCMIAMFLVSITYAQSDFGSITGFVKDPSGAVVPKAKVVIQNEGTGEERPITTNDAGYYAMPALQPGYYTVTAGAAGFKKFESAHVKLNPNSILAVDASLVVGANTETVEVSASAAVLQTESGAVQHTVTGTQVQVQELNGRDPVRMAQLLPGVRGGGTIADFNFAIGNPNLNVNGARQQDTLVTYDGAPALRTRGSTQVIGVMNVDSVQEIQVLTSNYAAEYGRAAGGQFRIVTKSGTRDFHGSLYEYFRNSALNANTWSRNLSTATNFASPFRYNNPGFTIGGPIWTPGVGFLSKMRDKLFFFVAEDWTRYRYTDTQTQAVPTMPMRQGNFSELLGANPWYKTGTIIYDPATCASAGVATCAALPGNVIPAGRLSRNGVALMNAYPQPTPGYLSGTQNWVAQAGHPINQRKETLNFDIQAADKHHIYGRRTSYSYFEYTPFQYGSGTTPVRWSRPNQTNTAGWTWTISPTLINEARLSLSLDDVYIATDSTGLGWHRDQLGINYPYVYPKDTPDRIPNLNMPNFYGLQGGSYPAHSSGPVWIGSDSVSKVWRNHLFKLGASFDYSGENDIDYGTANPNGIFTFTDTRTGLGGTSGVGMSNLALGLADSYVEEGPRAEVLWRGWMWEFFAQDSWKATQKLHIDYGVRVSSIQAFHPLWANASYFYPQSYNPAQAVQVDPKTGNVLLGTGNPYNGVVIPGFSTWPKAAIGRVLAATSDACYGKPCNGLFAPNLSKNFVDTVNPIQPRIGLAYQLTSKTVVRAGVGRYVDRLYPQMTTVFPGANPPVLSVASLSDVSVDNPGASLGAATTAPSLAFTTDNTHLKQPEAWNWNVTVERQMPMDSVLAVGYVGHRGLHGWELYNINQVQASVSLKNPSINLNYLVPYKGFSSIQEEESVVNSMYNSLQVSWNRRFRSGWSFGVSYTYSKSMDGGSGAANDLVPDTYDTSNLWGPSSYDSRHVAVVNYIYDLPFFKLQRNVVGKLLGGWEIIGVVQFQTGTPASITTTNDYAGVGGSGLNGGNINQYWVVNGPATINTGAFAGPVTTSNSPRYVTVNVTPPPAGTFNLQKGIRNFIYQPGLQAWNLGLRKAFKINERSKFEFRAEAYDFINHPNLNGPNLNPTSSQFGMITGKSGLARNIQLSLRFLF